MSTCKNIAIFHVYAVVRTSIIFWDMKMTNIYGNTSIFYEECDRTIKLSESLKY